MRLIVLLFLVVSCSSTVIRNGKEVEEIFIKDIISNINMVEHIEKLSLLSDVSIDCTDSKITERLFSIKVESSFVTLPSFTGLFQCSLKALSSRRNVVSDFNILISAANTSTIIVDIDNTIADANPIQFLINDYKSLKQLPNASVSLNKMVTKYQVIYLTARNEIFKRHTKKWLAHNSFPPGPVLYWNLTDYSFFDSKYKTQRISELKESLSNIAFAVGDKDSDILAYLANGLKTIIIRDTKSIVTDVEFVSGWDEIVETYF